jgi:type I restriction enzyme M protein
MNLAIRGLDSSQVKWNSEGSFLNDAHKDLKADYIIANPPFNVSDWSGDLLRKDGRWQYGVPPEGNANFAWMQHFIYHLSPSGQAGVVLAKGALTSKSSGEGEIRKAWWKRASSTASSTCPPSSSSTPRSPPASGS